MLIKNNEKTSDRSAPSLQKNNPPDLSSDESELKKRITQQLRAKQTLHREEPSAIANFGEFLLDTGLPWLTAIYRDTDYDPRFPSELQKLKVLPAKAAVTAGLLGGLIYAGLSIASMASDNFLLQAFSQQVGPDFVSHLGATSTASILLWVALLLAFIAAAAIVARAATQAYQASKQLPDLEKKLLIAQKFKESKNGQSYHEIEKTMDKQGGSLKWAARGFAGGLLGEAGFNYFIGKNLPRTKSILTKQRIERSTEDSFDQEIDNRFRFLL